MKIGEYRIGKIKASFANIALFLSIFVVLFPLTLPTVSATGGTWRYVGGTGPGIQQFRKLLITRIPTIQYMFIQVHIMKLY